MRRGRLLIAFGGLIALACGCQSQSEAPVVSAPHEAEEGPIQFTEVTHQAGLDFTHSHGGNGAHYYIETMGPGCAFVDYNQDDWLDVLLLQGAPLPGAELPQQLHPALYRNNRDGTFSDVTTSLGLDREIYCVGVAVADYDNDRWPDLFFTTLHGNRLFRNVGGERYVDVTDRAGVVGRDMSTGAAWLDYDQDGHLDLFVGRYMDYDLTSNPRCTNGQGQPAYCTPQVYEPTHSILYRNNRDGTFADVTHSAGIDEAEARAMGIACADFNEDGLVDIFVASDMCPNLLFLNQGDRTFKESGVLAGVAYGTLGAARAGMGVDCADYDNDGKLDIVVTNFENEPNSLFRCLGAGQFQEQSQISGVAHASNPALSWGCKFVDFDLDGHTDLFWVSGHVNDYADNFNQQMQLLHNRGDGSFGDVSEQCGSCFKRRHVARGAAFGDFDNDGDHDVLIGCNNQPAVLLRNDSTSPNGWVRLKLIGQGCNRDSLGARVRVTAGGTTQCQSVRSGTSYLSDHDRRLVFGIGDASEANVEIQWPCGHVQTLDVSAGESITVRETECHIASPMLSRRYDYSESSMPD